jgi:cyclohexa-1,5-dienecarbonyl-CoA hydratase
VGALPANIRSGLATEILPLAKVAIAYGPPVAHITLNNPPVNVIDISMMAELSSALAEIESQAEISIVVLRGDADCFCAGVDIAAHTPDKINEMLERFHAVVRALVATSKVTVAAVHGKCLGGGAELAMMCDVVITTDEATWGFPEITLGCFPPVAAAGLSSLIGQKRASDLILTGAPMLGQEAASIGLATRSVVKDQLDAALDATLDHLKKSSPAVLAIAKKAIYAWDSMRFDKGLMATEKIYLDELMKTEDAQEGVQSFLAKRKPEWKGR